MEDLTINIHGGPDDLAELGKKRNQTPISIGTYEILLCSVKIPPLPEGAVIACSVGIKGSANGPNGILELSVKPEEVTGLLGLEENPYFRIHAIDQTGGVRETMTFVTVILRNDGSLTKLSLYGKTNGPIFNVPENSAFLGVYA